MAVDLSGCAGPEKKLSETAMGGGEGPPTGVLAAETLAVPTPTPPHNTSSDEVRQLLTQLGKRIDVLETQLASMNDKLDSTRTALDRMAGAGPQKTAATQVIAHPSENSGTSISPVASHHDPDAGFINDEAIQSFRKALILLQAQKYPEAVLAFSGFLEKFPDHPLAGSAQFYVGESYMRQKEYKLALQEFQRVLTSYDRSAHVADTLNEMAQAEENLKKSHEASLHRQQLSSLFPQSPAATSPKKIEAKEPEPEHLEPIKKIDQDTGTVPNIPLTAPIEDSVKTTTLDQ